MKIVVTGAAGFIGSHLCERLALEGHAVLGIDSFDDYLYPADDKRRNARELEDATAGADFRLIEADVCDSEAMTMAIGESVDLVCHLAALAGVRPSLRAPQRYMRTNVEGTVTVAEACRAANVKRFVFASSSSVYGVQTRQRPFAESDACLLPASPYAASKRCGELVLSTYRDLYGLGVMCLRFFTVYGPRQRPDMAIHKFVQAISTGEPITIFGDGRSRRDYTYVEDIIAGVVAAIEQCRPGAFEVLNLGGAVTTELGELVARIEGILGKTAIVEYRADQKGDVPWTFADTRRARALVHYQPKVSVQEGLELYIADLARRVREAAIKGEPSAESTVPLRTPHSREH